MTPFLTKILNNDLYMQHLFNFKNWYKNSYLEEDMSLYSTFECEKTEELGFYLKNKFIAEKTNWLYIDHRNNLYGVLDKFVIQCDNEGTFFYFCHGFHNIPLRFIERLKINHDYDLEKNYVMTTFNVNLDQLLKDYQEFCVHEKEIFQIYYNEDDFEQYIKRNIHL